jgi:hypothetical protein
VGKQTETQSQNCEEMHKIAPLDTPPLPPQLLISLLLILLTETHAGGMAKCKWAFPVYKEIPAIEEQIVK